MVHLNNMASKCAEYPYKSQEYVLEDLYAYFMQRKAFCMTNLVRDPWGCSFRRVWKTWAIIFKEQGKNVLLPQESKLIAKSKPF